MIQIARTHSRRGDFDAAHRILDEVEPLLSDDYPGRYSRRGGISAAPTELLGRWEEAKELQEEMLSEFESRELPVYGYVYEELAELYHRTGDPRASTNFRLAYEALSKDVWMVNSQVARSGIAGAASSNEPPDLIDGPDLRIAAHLWAH